MGCNISLLGIDCVRDIFEFHEDDAGYVVDRFVQSISPISAVSNKILLKEFDLGDEVIKNIFKNKTNVYKKMVTLDLTKQTFSYLSEAHSDYLLIDAGNFRYDLLRDDSRGGYLTDLFPEINKALIKESYISSNATCIELSSFNDIDFENYMEKYVAKIKEIYNEQKIVLYEILCVPFFVNKARNRIGIFDYDKVQKQNQNIERGFKILKEKLPNSHVVEFPQGVLGDEGHKWGSAPLHYIPEYYEYGLDALKIITTGQLSFSDEKEQLAELKRAYEIKIKQIYEPICVRSLQSYSQRDSLCTRMQAYEEYMKNLLMNRDNMEKIKNFFMKNYYSRCAFYGLTELSKLFIFLFKQWGISIDYVVENSTQKEFAGIKIIKRSEPSYPDTEVMIIADVVSYKKIKEKLASQNVPYPYFDVYDLLK